MLRKKIFHIILDIFLSLCHMIFFEIMKNPNQHGEKCIGMYVPYIICLGSMWEYYIIISDQDEIILIRLMYISNILSMKSFGFVDTSSSPCPPSYWLFARSPDHNIGSFSKYVSDCLTWRSNYWYVQKADFKLDRIIPVYPKQWTCCGESLAFRNSPKIFFLVQLIVEFVLLQSRSNLPLTSSKSKRLYAEYESSNVVLMHGDTTLLFLSEIASFQRFFVFLQSIGIVCCNDYFIRLILFAYLCRIIYCVAANDVTQVRQQYGFTIKSGMCDQFTF